MPVHLIQFDGRENRDARLVLGGGWRWGKFAAGEIWRWERGIRRVRSQGLWVAIAFWRICVAITGDITAFGVLWDGVIGGFLASKC